LTGGPLITGAWRQAPEIPQAAAAAAALVQAVATIIGGGGVFQRLRSLSLTLDLHCTLNFDLSQKAEKR
jgi:hypothetical protein